MKRLTVQISSENHNQIKAFAAIKGLSLKDYVMSCILPENLPNSETLKAIKDVELNRDLINYNSVSDLIFELKKEC